MINPEQVVEGVVDAIFETTPEEVDKFIDDVVAQAIGTFKREHNTSSMSTDLQLSTVARLAASLAAGRGVVVSEVPETIDLTQPEDASQRPNVQMKAQTPLTARIKED